MVATNTGGDVTAADVRSVLTDILDTLFHEAGGGTPVVGSHTRYFGWSGDTSISAADLSGAAESTDNTGTLPARTGNGYIFFAVPSVNGYPSQLLLGNTALFGTPFTQQSGTIDDDEGEAHLVGVTALQQADTLADQAVELRY